MIKLSAMALAALLIMALAPVLPAQAGGMGIPIPASSNIPDIINALEQGYAKLNSSQWEKLWQVNAWLTTPQPNATSDPVADYVYSRLSVPILGTSRSILAEFREATGNQVAIGKDDIKNLLDLARSLASVKKAGAGWDARGQKLTDAKRAEITQRLTALKSGLSDLTAWLQSSSPEGQFIDFIKAVNYKLRQRTVSVGDLETPLIASALEVLRRSGASSYPAVYKLAEAVLKAANQVIRPSSEPWTLENVPVASVENGLAALFLALDAGDKPSGIRDTLFQDTYQAVLDLIEPFYVDYHKTFNDIRGSFAKADIEYLASRHIIYGVTDTRFDPLGRITRAQFCALVARALNLSAPQNAPSFRDVSGSYWAAKEIRAAAAAGIVKGYTDGSFKPDQFINREQLAAMVARALVYSHGGTLPTPDQAQTILARFQDRNRITTGLLREVALAADKGIVLGTTDKRFDPFGTATREQAAAMVARMYRQL